MHEIAFLATYYFKVFRGSIRPDPLKLDCQFSADRVSALNYNAACCAYLTHMKTSAKNPDQILEKIPIKRMHHGGFVNL